MKTEVTRASKFELAFLIMTFYVTLSVPQVSSYAKVSKNGEEAKESQDETLSWIGRTLNRDQSNDGNTEEEGRSVKNIHITVSPVYVPPRSPNLKNGEAIDYSSTKGYSTLDKELLAKLDAASANKKQLQDRFHLHASFNHGNKDESSPKPMKPNIGSSGPPNSETPSFLRPTYVGPYSYKPPEYADSYKPPPSDSYTDPSEDTDFPKFPNNPGTDGQMDQMPNPPFDDDSFDQPEDHHPGGNEYPPHHHHHEEVIYEKPPDYYLDHHHHHHHYEEEHTTPEAETNDQRLDKRPYSYYFIGKKLWYIPLYFSIYFIIYIAALVLKSIARHKINFPAHLAEVAQGHARSNHDDHSWWNLTARVLGGVERFAERFSKNS